MPPSDILLSDGAFLGLADVTEPFNNSGIALDDGDIPGIAAGERTAAGATPKHAALTVFVVAEITPR